MIAENTARPDTRRAQIIGQASQLFAARGYERTSMRDIAGAVGMLPGSVYYHFASKGALRAAVYADAIDDAIAAVQKATSRHTDAWDPLEAASIAHLTTLLDGGSIAAVIADSPAHGAPELVGHRHRYEAVFRDLVDDIAMPPGVSASHFRLALLGALNWALTWFKPGGCSPEAVARGLFAVFRANAFHPSDRI